MYRIAGKPISALLFIPLILLIALASACGENGPVSREQTATPLPPAAATTASPTATSVPTPMVTPTLRGPLAVVPAETVELSVLIEPLDVGYAEVVGSLRLSNGDATEVHRNDQINLIARPVDPKQWRFDRWGETSKAPSLPMPWLWTVPKRSGPCSSVSTTEPETPWRSMGSR